MLMQMRTTINLPEDLIRKAKKAALETNTRLSEFIADATRVALNSRRRKRSRREFKIIASGNGGLLPGINSDDTSALLDMMCGIDKD
jgi:hypothetical protein